MHTLIVYEREFLKEDEAYRNGWYFLFMKIEHGPYDSAEEASSALEQLLDDRQNCKHCGD